MALTDADLRRIERDLDDLRKPKDDEVRDMLSEIRASRTELRTLNAFAAEVAGALRKAGEVR